MKEADNGDLIKTKILFVPKPPTSDGGGEENKRDEEEEEDTGNGFLFRISNVFCSKAPDIKRRRKG